MDSEVTARSSYCIKYGLSMT